MFQNERYRLQRYVLPKGSDRHRLPIPEVLLRSLRAAAHTYLTPVKVYPERYSHRPEAPMHQTNPLNLLPDVIGSSAPQAPATLFHVPQTHPVLPTLQLSY